MKKLLSQTLRRVYNHTFRKYIAEDIFVAIKNNNSFILAKQYQNIETEKKSNSIVLFFTPVTLSPEKRAEIVRRFYYFFDDLQIKTVRNLDNLPITINQPVLITDEYTQLNLPTHNFMMGTFDVDYDSNPFADWGWHLLMQKLNLCTEQNRYDNAHIEITRYIKALKKLKYGKTYIFGTGPSLANVNPQQFRDGYRIVCNTIVKDQKLWQDIAPHFFVAADGIFHFGPSPYAQAFRRDLKQRLSENLDVRFCYPGLFDTYVKREFKDFTSRLIPIPTNEKYRQLNPNLVKRYFLPSLGNVLTYMLLPLACTLTKEVDLWGFDGRKPGDTLFWKHSPNHNYEDLLPTVIAHHPAFFRLQVPQNNPTKYVDDNLGDRFDQLLRTLESKGYRFKMLHPSAITALHRREVG